MRLSTETAFGHYKILSQIGAGGMGEVYLARDTKLERKVALKILPEKFTADADRVRRFVQEARAASALNHPNIITIYEIGEFDGANYIAAELIEGKTLREIIGENCLSLAELLDAAIQTVEALAAAHTVGIVHRDIKPENIMMRSDGYLKVLDFGLAKLTEKQYFEADSEAATQKIVKTNPGVLMGTVSYMSPEQARGKEVDTRSDVFSFGIVLYEMITGRVPFEGESMTDVWAAILNREPLPLERFVADVPKELQRIVNKTLRKKQTERYQSTVDLLGDLKDLREELTHEAKLQRSGAPNKSKISTSSGTSKDALLLTEFENLTGDAVFDATLKMALAFSLEQSPFLDIFADERVRQTLRLMGRSSDERVTRELGKEICQRKGLKAFIAGIISTLGTSYVLTLEAINVQTGETIGRQLEQAESKEQVLKALGQAASGLREKLGESLSSIEQFDAPLDNITTESLEALRAYTLGHERFREGFWEADPFFKRAIELDPNFASAYLSLGSHYNNTSQPKLAAEYVTKAYQLRDRVSEIERFRISYSYYRFVTGEIEKSIETLELYKKTYPQDWIPLTNLCSSYCLIGQFEKAIIAASDSIKINPNTISPYHNLISALLSLNRFDEAKKTLEKMVQKVVYVPPRLLCYEMWFIEGDLEAMQKEIDAAKEERDKHRTLDWQTNSAAFRGQWRKSQDFSRRAIELAARNDAVEVAAQYAAEQALRIVFWSSGAGLPSPNNNQLKIALKTQTQKALKFERSKVTLTRSALALAIGGQTSEAEKLLAELKTEYPQDTLVNGLWLPLIKAALRLQNNKLDEAIEELETAEKFERAAEFYPQYIRGLIYLKLGKAKKAAVEFEKILNHQGESPLSALYPLAQLGKARVAKNKAEYEKFFELWKDADNDMPALVEAKKEYDNL